jgi:hypothetical protein
MSWHDDLRGGLRASGLSSNARHVVRVQSEFADFATGRNSYASNGTMASETGLSIRAVIRALQELEAAGWILRSGKAPRGVVIYEITPPPMPESHSGEDSSSAPARTQLARSSLTALPHSHTTSTAPKPHHNNKRSERT